MRARLAVLLFSLLLGLGVTGRAQEIETIKSLDSLYFLAGLSIYDGSIQLIVPPRCNAFFRDSGEQRVAEMFLEVAQTRAKATSSDEPTAHYYDPNGSRYVVTNYPLAISLQAFYTDPALNNLLDHRRGYNEPSVFSLLGAGQKERLSFVAGVYARRCRNRVFNGFPSTAMRETVLTLLLEGCEITNLTIDHAVPTTMNFKVKPSERIERLFDLIDKWQPLAVEWKPR